MGFPRFSLEIQVKMKETCIPYFVYAIAQTILNITFNPLTPCDILILPILVGHLSKQMTQNMPGQCIIGSVKSHV